MSDVTDAENRFAHLRAVGLNKIEFAAALRKRVDRKYLLGDQSVADLVSSLPKSTRVLEVDGSRSLRYQTVYFDTPDRDIYLASARGRPQRFKVRTRTYLDSRTSFLEVKMRDRTGLTVKHRTPCPYDLTHTLTTSGQAFLTEFESVAPIVERLEPSLVVTYRRTTLLEPETMSRLTIDTAVEASTPRGGFVEVGDEVLVETKTTLPPTAADRLLWSRHYRPTTFSKYCTLLAAIEPRLPANKWSRTLRRHLGWRPEAGTRQGEDVESGVAVPQH